MSDNPNPGTTAEANHASRPLDAQKQPAMSADQSRSMLNVMVKAGTLTAEQAQEKLKAAGLATEPDVRTEQQRAFDKTFGGVEASAYRFDDVARDMPDAKPAEIEARHAGYQKWASDLKLPPAIARSLVADHFGVLRETARMTDAQKEAWGNREQAKFIRIIGANHEARAAAAADALKKISGRDIKLGELARSNGAAIAANLLLHAERLATRPANLQTWR